MRKNNKLAMAVAATLFSFSATEVVLASGLSNLTDTATVVNYAREGAAGTVDASGVNAGTVGATVAVQTNFVNSGDADEGTTYAAELFGTSPSALPSGAFSGVIYQIDGAIDEDFYLTFSLSGGATFVDTVELFTNANTGSLQSDTLYTGSVSPQDNQVKFTIEVDDDVKIDAKSKFLLKYKLANTAEALSNTGGKIEMTVLPTSVGQTAYLVNVQDSLTVAQSTQAVTIEIVPTSTPADTKIATELGNTEFTSATDNGDVYVDTNTIRLGAIKVTHDETAMSEDGVTQFTLGGTTTTDDGGINEAKLNIVDGQFFASMEDPGEVKLEGITTDVVISEDGTTATFDLTDVMDELSDTLNIAGGDADDDFIKETDILVVVDNKTEINIPENSPCANLDVDYEGSNVNDLSSPSEGCTSLPKVSQDGTVCWVNIIPKADAVNDRLVILITNDGVADGELIGTFYDQQGTQLFGPKVMTDKSGETILGAGKTMRFFPADLGAMMEGSDADNPGTWTGRSSLKIATTLSDIEIMALIRDVKTNINSNVSTGAAGPSCVSN